MSLLRSLRIFVRAVLQICRAYGAGKKRDATMVNVPPLARAVLVLMGFNIEILIVLGFTHFENSSSIAVLNFNCQSFQVSGFGVSDGVWNTGEFPGESGHLTP